LYLSLSRQDCPLLFPLSNVLVFSAAHVYSQSYCRFSLSGGHCTDAAVDWRLSPFSAGADFSSSSLHSSLLWLLLLLGCSCLCKMQSHILTVFAAQSAYPIISSIYEKAGWRCLTRAKPGNCTIVKYNLTMHWQNTILYITCCAADIATFFSPSCNCPVHNVACKTWPLLPELFLKSSVKKTNLFVLHSGFCALEISRQ
jgi:hypothetical protein